MNIRNIKKKHASNLTEDIENQIEYLFSMVLNRKTEEIH